MLTGTTIIINNDRFTLTPPPPGINLVDTLLDLREKSYRDVIVRTYGQWDQAIQQNEVEKQVAVRLPSFIMNSGNIIGTAALFIDEDDMLIIGMLRVLPEWQGIGLGTAIIRQSIRIAETMGVDLVLGALKGNPSARSLYERLGFVQYEEVSDEYYMVYKHE